MFLNGRVIWLGLVVAVAGACSLIDEKLEPCDPNSAVPVDFAFSLQKNESVTKADDAFTELSEAEDPSTLFRGMNSIRLIPFSLGSKTQILYSSQALGIPRRISRSISNVFSPSAFDGESFHDGLVQGNHSHFFSSQFISLPTGTSAVLMYGKAPLLDELEPELVRKMRNGSLIERGLDVQDYLYASQIKFDPDPILGSEATDAALAIEELLNKLATASYSQHYYYWITSWNEGDVTATWGSPDLEESTLKTWFQQFSGNGSTVPGASSLLEDRLTTLYQNLKGYTSTDSRSVREDEYIPRKIADQESEEITYAHVYNGLCKKLVDVIEANAGDGGVLTIDEGNKIRFAAESLQDFPAAYQLPAGSAVFRWNGANMVFEKSGLDGILPMDHLCFMPSLYYYVNTTLSTAYDPYIYEYYTSNYTWGEILSRYSFGKVVMEGVRSVALDNPLQYSCALLRATLRSESMSISDGHGKVFDISSTTNGKFPLLGIVIGSQFQQNFDFSPVTENEDVDTPEEFFMYDNILGGINLYTSSEQTAAPFRTLVLPSPKDRDVYFFLEFCNNSGESFTGIDGVVKPGNAFYLAGKIPAPTASDVSDGNDRIFMSDRYTTVNCVANSLENAYLTLPQMGDPELRLGVKTQVNWVFSGTSYVVLD